MTSNTTKKQHYVWRAYLAAWADENQIQCLMNGKIFSSNLMGVAQERYFYRLHELNEIEKNLIRQFTNQISQGNLKESNLDWMKMFDFVFEQKNQFEKHGLMTPEVAEIFKAAELQLEESLHSMIEGNSKKYLEMLLQLNSLFYDDDKSAMEFIFFFALQFVRTTRILENMKQFNGDIEGVDITKVWSVLKIIVATNIGWSLFAKRSQYKLHFLTTNNTRFIAGDQPIINTYAVNFEITPEQVEFYYPISPYIALLITESKRDKITLIEEKKVRELNEMIFKSSHRQIYALERSDLEPFVLAI